MIRRTWPAWAAFLVLFLAYQAPEGIGIHLLGRPAVQAVLLLLFFPVAWGVARARGYWGFEAYAMERAPRWAPTLGATLLLALAVKAVAVAVGLRLGVYAVEAEAPASGDLLLALLGIAFTTVWPSVAEDIVTRGFWARQVPALGRGVGFVLATSALYVLNHVYRLHEGPLEWLMLFAFGLAYATALVRTGTLWAAIGLHWGWNIAAFATTDVFGVVTERPLVGPILSAAAHLVALGVVLLATTARAEGAGSGRRMAASA